MKKILHVDDDPIVLDIVQATFRHHKEISVLSVMTAEDALALIQTKQPDLIIADIAMPDMGGFELIHRLRGVPQIKRPPIIILSGRLGSFVEHKLFQEMIAVTLEKPVAPDRLRHKIEGLLAYTPA